MMRYSILLLACLLLPLAAPARAQENLFEASENRLAVSKPAAPYGYIGTQKERNENRFLVRLQKLELTNVKLNNASMEDVLVYIYDEARKQGIDIAFDGYRLSENSASPILFCKAETTGWDLLSFACAHAHYFFYPGYACQTQNHIEVSDEPVHEPWEWVVPENQREQFYKEYSQTHQNLKDYLEAHGFAFSWSDSEYPDAAFAWQEWVGDYDPRKGEFSTWLMPCAQEALADFFKKKGFNLKHQLSKARKVGFKPIAARDEAECPTVQVQSQGVTSRNARWWVSSNFLGFISTSDRASIMEVLRNRGVAFPDDNSHRVSYNDGTEELLVRGTPMVLNSVHQLIKKHNEQKEEFYRLPEGFVAPYITELSPGGQNTLKELCKLELPSVYMERVSLEEALEFLQQATKDAGLGRLEFDYKNLYGIAPKVSVQTNPMKAIDFLDLLCKQTMTCMEIDGQKITLKHDFSERTGGMSSGTWEVSAAFFGKGTIYVRRHKSAPISQDVSHEDAIDFFKAQDCSFPTGSSLTYNSQKGILRVINTRANLDMVDNLLKNPTTSQASQSDEYTPKTRIKKGKKRSSRHKKSTRRTSM